MTDYDVIVVGAGHNGLVCAAELAQAGRRVLVLEANETPGGAAITREFAPGYSVSGCAQWLYQFNPAVQKKLSLGTHGLRLAARDLASIALGRDGEHVTLAGNSVSGSTVSVEDQAALKELNRITHKFAKLLAKLFTVRPPAVVEGNLSDRWNMLKLGLDLKLMGREDMSEFMRLILINMYDVMEERFDSDQLKALLSMDGILGTHMGPRSPNSVFTYLYRRVGEVYGYAGPAVVEGGMGTLGKALASAATAAGAEVRYGAHVASIDTDAGRVTGVSLSAGEQIAADLVVSGADPVTTFKQLLGFRNLETGVVRRVSQIRMQGSAAKLHLALDGMPAFTGLSDTEHGNRLVIAQDMNYLERAFNNAKYGEYSMAPAMDISIPTVHDSSLAPEGKHVLSAIVQYVPYDLRSGWDDGAREQLVQQLTSQLDRYAPGLTDMVVASELLTPVDIEREFHINGGHWHHGELSLDQVLMMRPFPGASQYASPVPGLYLCGAGSHPGGGLMGLAGHNAAGEILKGGTLS